MNPYIVTYVGKCSEKEHEVFVRALNKKKAEKWVRKTFWVTSIKKVKRQK